MIPGRYRHPSAISGALPGDDPKAGRATARLATTVEQLQAERGQLTRLLKALGISTKKLDEYLQNPFQPLPNRLIRRCESFLGKPSAWMDQQHVEINPVCTSFPEDMRRLMTIYSELPPLDCQRLLRTVEAFANIDNPSH